MALHLLNHYRKLWFFNFNRFKSNNYQLMREYFAEILIMDVERFMPLQDKKVLDVGGATGTFCRTISRKRSCRAINLDPHAVKYNPGEPVWPQTTVGFADNIPYDDNEFDLVICRGVLEHIPVEKQQKSVNEMYRVTKVGGICYILIPPWYNPHAGHRLKPFHVLPFKVAKYLRQLFFRKKIDASSLAELGLYPITFRRMLDMISASGFRLLTTRDSHFRLHVLTRIPLIREIMVPAAAFILTKQATIEMV